MLSVFLTATSWGCVEMEQMTVGYVEARLLVDVGVKG